MADDLHRKRGECRRAFAPFSLCADRKRWSMTERNELQSPTAEHTPMADPIESRFLFVDVAAQRAKQLRRGARVRINPEVHRIPVKLERIAMEEVKNRLVQFQLPAESDVAA